MKYRVMAKKQGDPDENAWDHTTDLPADQARRMRQGAEDFDRLHRASHPEDHPIEYYIVAVVLQRVL